MLKNVQMLKKNAEAKQALFMYLHPNITAKIYS